MDPRKGMNLSSYFSVGRMMSYIVYVKNFKLHSCYIVYIRYEHTYRQLLDTFTDPF